MIAISALLWAVGAVLVCRFFYIRGLTLGRVMGREDMRRLFGDDYAEEIPRDLRRLRIVRDEPEKPDDAA